MRKKSTIQVRNWWHTLIRISEILRQCNTCRISWETNLNIFLRKSRSPMYNDGAVNVSRKLRTSVLLRLYLQLGCCYISVANGKLSITCKGLQAVTFFLVALQSHQSLCSSVGVCICNSSYLSQIKYMHKHDILQVFFFF